MKSKLLLTLWLLGAVLYAGSTIFVAQTLLGGTGGATPADKAKSATLAAAAAKCEKDSVASTEADPIKTAAVESKKAAEPQRPAPASSAKPDAVETAKPKAANPAPEAGQDVGSSEEDASQDQAALDPDQGQSQSPWDQDEAGMQRSGEDQAEDDEWAHVVAGTADMRSEPSLRSPLIYALPAGWQVRVVSRQNGWVQVQDANSGAAGWVEATAIAPGAGPHAAGRGYGPNGQPGYGRYPPQYGDPYGRYAEESNPYGPPPWQRRRERRGEFADFLRRAFGGF